MYVFAFVLNKPFYKKSGFDCFGNSWDLKKNDGDARIVYVAIVRHRGLAI
jgi:hypothetical protein